MAALPVDDKDLDDAALWAVIDSAAAAAASYSSSSPTTTRFRKPSPLKPSNLLSPSPSPPLAKPRYYASSPPHDFRRPQKMFRSSASETGENTGSPELALVTHCPVRAVYSSPESLVKLASPFPEKENVEDKFVHCLAGPFPTVSLFRDYLDKAMSILDKADYTMISGNPFIKKSGWRKLAFYFNVSFEIKDKTIDFDENHNVQRAEFVVRASMQGGRFSDGWGSCERREKKFMKPNNDIPSTAETRAKNKACQDLLGIGQYRPGITHGHSPSPR